MPGDFIKFGSVTTYQNGPATKTDYSGDYESGGLERIDWVLGDKIRIKSDKAVDRYNSSNYYADYKISGFSASDRKSVATVEPCNGNGLVWGDDGIHQFYGIYPSTAANDQISFDGSTLNKVRMTIPGSQQWTYTPFYHPNLEEIDANIDSVWLKPNMNYAYMSAAVQARNTDQAVQLSFKPMFSAFKFMVDVGSANDDAMDIVSFTLSSASKAMWGSCDATIPGSTLSDSPSFSNFPSATTENKVITVTFTSAGNSTGLHIVKGKPVAITVFALPQEYNDLTASFVTAHGDTHTLQLKKTDNTFFTFAACQKYNIYGLGLPSDHWTYTLEGLNDIVLTFEGASNVDWSTIKSYRRRGRPTDADPGTPLVTTEEVPFKLQYSLDGSTWSDTPPADDHSTGTPITSDWLTALPSSTISESAGDLIDGYSLQMTMGHQAETPTDDVHTYHLRKEVSSVTDMDLSLYDGNGTALGAGMHTTANCYIVRAPGTYKFPLVYGNALRNGQVNESAFHRLVNDGHMKAMIQTVYDEGKSRRFTAEEAESLRNNHFIEYFVDHNGESIKNDGTAGTNFTNNSIYIADRFSGLSAVLLWADAHDPDPLKPDIITDVDISTSAQIGSSGHYGYVTFEVLKDAIMEGNAVIAVKKGSDIVWSWHIWISDETLSTHDGSNGFKFATDDIGWVNGTRHVYHSRTCYVKAVQLPADNADTPLTSASKTITQSAADDYDPLGNSSYFQWGRKDPFPGSKGTLNERKNVWLYNGCPDNMSAEGKATLASSIKFPYLHYEPSAVSDEAAQDDWCSQSYYNNWNSSSLQPYDYSQIEATSTIATTKTIYDPSPVGFMVPPPAAYQSYTVDSFVWQEESVTGYEGYPQGAKVGDVFIPATGYIDKKYKADVSNYRIFGVEDSNDKRPEIYYWSSAAPPVSTQAFTLRYWKAKSTDAAQFATKNAWYRACGFSILPVREKPHYCRIYLKDGDFMHISWGTPKIKVGSSSAVTPTLTETIGGVTYKYIDIEVTTPSANQTIKLVSGDESRELTLGTKDIKGGAEYFFRSNGLEAFEVTDPANPDAYTNARVYVKESIGSLHDALWASGYTRKLEVWGDNGNVDYLPTAQGPVSFDSESYYYFDIPLNTEVSSATVSSLTSNPGLEYRSYDGNTQKGSVWIDNASLQNGGEFFYHLNAHHTIAVSNPSSAGTTRAIVYVLDETSTSSVSTAWGSARTLSVGSIGDRSMAGTEEISDGTTTKTYTYFVIPTENSSYTGNQALEFKGENGLQISLGSVTIAAGGEYFFRANGSSSVQISSPTTRASLTSSLPSLPIRTRIFVLDDINVSQRYDWDPYHSGDYRGRQVRPALADGNGDDRYRWYALVGTASINGYSYDYFDVTPTTNSVDGHILYGQRGGTSHSYVESTDNVSFSTGGEFFFRTNGVQCLKVTDTSSLPNYTISRIYVKEDINTSIHTEWGDAAANPSRRIWVKYSSSSGNSFETNGTVTFKIGEVSYTYRYVDITDLSQLDASSGNDMYYKCWNGSNNNDTYNAADYSTPIQATIWSAIAKVKTPGGYFYRTDGKSTVKITDLSNPNSNPLPSRIYVTEDFSTSSGHLSEWGSHRRVSITGYRQDYINRSGKEQINGTLYYYFNISYAASDLSSATDVLYKNRKEDNGEYYDDCEVKIASAAIQNGNTELFYRTNGIRVVSIPDPTTTLPSYPSEGPYIWVASPSTSIRIYWWWGSGDNENGGWEDDDTCSTMIDSKYGGGNWWYHAIDTRTTSFLIFNEYWPDSPDPAGSYYYWQTADINMTDVSSSYYYYVNNDDTEHLGYNSTKNRYEYYNMPYYQAAP